MSQTTKEINRITGVIIGICTRLIVYALVILLLYEGVTKGYAFGHEIFYASAVEKAPGTDYTVTVEKGESVSGVAKALKNHHLITNELSFQIQAQFFDYDVNPGTYVLNTSMTSKEMLQMMNENNIEDEESKQ